jgi:PAS domain S-box-containing protein
MNVPNGTVRNEVNHTGFDPIEELPVAYVEMNADGIITLANREARALHSVEQDDIVGRQVWEFSPQSQVEFDRNAFFATINSGEEPPITRRSLYTRGEFRTYELHRSLIRNAEGLPVGIRGATIDVTEAQRANEEANRARLWLESVLESMSEAIIITDSLGFIRSVNPATEEMFGWPADELIGKVIEKAFPLLSYISDNKVQLCFNMSLQSRSRGVATMLDCDRCELQVEISTSPILDMVNGFTTGVVSVMHRVDSVPQYRPG